ncbi:MAG TPA: LacI family DNA-binding transcriptional regulator [Candidatus Dormibacteraeota bacterium]
MTDKKRSTLESIARQLGVSKMTVSNAYNRPDQLSPELRERVLGAARELGYPGPNPLASTLRRGRVGAVGMVFDEPVSFALSDPAAALIVRGLASVCETERAGLLLVPGVPGGEAGIDLVRTALVDGFIFYCDYEGDPRLKVLRDRGMPYVLVDAPAVADVSWVGIDDRGGAQLAAQHLLDLGHRSFGIVSFNLVPDDYEGPVTPERHKMGSFHVPVERLAGYRQALESAGIDWISVPIEERHPGPGGASAAGQSGGGVLLDRATRPTAILAMSDELALGVLRAAAQRGIEVPADLSVVGFDDTPAAAAADPPLTTISQPHELKGATAGRLLLDPPASGPQRVVLPTALVVRASSAPSVVSAKRPRSKETREESIR